jgi:hypothetical protein
MSSDTIHVSSEEYDELWLFCDGIPSVPGVNKQAVFGSDMFSGHSDVFTVFGPENSWPIAMRRVIDNVRNTYGYLAYNVRVIWVSKENEHSSVDEECTYTYTLSSYDTHIHMHVK